MGFRKRNDTDFNPTVKGNNNTAISTENGICVLDNNSYNDKTTTVKDVSLRFNDTNDNRKLKLENKGADISVIINKMSIKNCTITEFSSPTRTSIGEILFNDYNELEINKKKETDCKFDSGELKIQDKKNKGKYHVAELRNKGVYVSGKQTKTIIPNPLVPAKENQGANENSQN